MGATALYRPYDVGGRLLYVGIAADVEDRMDAHERDHWYADIAAVDVTLYRARRQAKAAETEAIKTEWPLWNIAESPWGAVASDRARQIEGYWRQDKWGDWHPVHRDVIEMGPWDDAAERQFTEKVQHCFCVRRLTRAALVEARWRFLQLPCQQVA